MAEIQLIKITLSDAFSMCGRDVIIFDQNVYLYNQNVY